MSGKDFFFNRYEKLGWNPRDVRLRQAIRINRFNVKNKDLLGRLNESGVTLEKIPFLKEGYFVIKSKVSVGATAEYLLGLYSIQEAAAQIPASLFTQLHGKKVLDYSAAPGGKTVQLADLMENTGAIVALDINKRRLTALSNHLERCHVSNVVVYLLDSWLASQLNVKFDRILVDAPCSGNFAADKDWFKHRTIQDVQHNANLQREILQKAAESLSSDGELVYSTCSLEPEENELNIDWAITHLGLETRPVDCPGVSGLTSVFGKKLDSSLRSCKRLWPDVTQGFFVCKMGWRQHAR